MKKIMTVLISAAVFCACSEMPDNTLNTEETDVIITEEKASEETAAKSDDDEPFELELSELDPFETGNESIYYPELKEAAKKISDGLAFLEANSTGFIYGSDYYVNSVDSGNILEENAEMEYSYAPLNPEIAKTEKELTDYMRSIFTERFISLYVGDDGEIEDELFGTFYEIPPKYKTIDGILCMKQQYMGVMDSVDFNRMALISCDGFKAEIMTGVMGVSDDGNVFFLELECSPEYGWRLDKMTEKFYDKNAINSLFTLSLQIDRLNIILDGNTNEKKSVEIDGEKYYASYTGMSIFYMKSFLENILSDELYKDYTERFIEGVYLEKDGVLYRKADAPKYYLLPMEIDLHLSSAKNYFDSNGHHYLNFNYNGNSDDRAMIEYSYSYDGEFISAKFSDCPLRKKRLTN